MTGKLHDIARRFSGGQQVLEITPLGNGLINTTFQVATVASGFVLQRLNSHVFPHPELLTDNRRRLERHVRAQPAGSVRLQIPELLSCHEGQTLCLDSDGHSWRAQQLIRPAESREHLVNPGEAAEVGFALGHFHGLCCDLPVGSLHDTLPGFHITPGYFRAYQRIIEIKPPAKHHADERFCQNFIAGFQDNIAVLERARQQGILNERVIHGDPKFNNFLFRPGSNHIVSLIDLDTVKPGLVHYDIADCLRSCCHQPQDNCFDTDLGQIILTNYLREAGRFFSAADYAYLYAAIQLIPFELGLRFFSDYLRGNPYFKVSEPEENLHRAVAQFQLCGSIAAQRAAIEGMIAALRG